MLMSWAVSWGFDTLLTAFLTASGTVPVPRSRRRAHVPVGWRDWEVHPLGGQKRRRGPRVPWGAQCPLSPVRQHAIDSEERGVSREM